MDPVTAIGLVASVDQLAGLAKVIVSNMYRYFDAVKDAPRRSQELRQELSAISDLLDSLEDALTSSTKSTFTAPDSLKSAITEFQETLEDMKARVKEPQTKGLRRLKWPFTKDENERLLSKLERYKSTFNVALNIKNA